MTKKLRRKYKLHQHIKKLNYRYSSQKKTVYVPFNDAVDNRFILELKNNFNYNIQFEIS